MQLIKISEDQTVEVLKTFSESFLREIGKERAEAFLSKYGCMGADMIGRSPSDGMYMICRSVIDSSEIAENVIVEEAPKKKRGRPKGSKNKPKEKKNEQ